MPTLAVNIDHVATLRQQRRGTTPDPVLAARIAQEAGAAGIIAHLREDRRHIQDADVRAIARQARCFNFEMAATEEMRAIALEVQPHLVCLVPEKREELTTEGGLAVAGRVPLLQDYCAPFFAAGIGVSLFIEASAGQVQAARDVGAQYIELHTGHYADAADTATREAELRKILDAIALGRSLGLTVNLGHGLDLDNMTPFAQVPGVNEYSIGFSIIGRAVFIGLDAAVREMLELLKTFAD
ncbi:pyridoxine 5'-phosphate synthase [Megalodesulfovibrio gigas]|uniref:Pyridoxine 5'-phosphate synthase n=1 Tax=Megalodesulfovibrio gigas (strain ATCC 19364 / DSM 1382 / NCIMB 9332 / VKM B-1759) TaxID=1121448 RepID=T2GCD4_MEGG1|nr:pyridoxine 5'-phosphate synthase [Megalodesulfovibrio gigas]AGW14235.1 putative pyridoxine 5'-phosphate synthase [Megalodesulfovibrio gigas DSM 1382 = ATCC 19364]